MAKSFVSFEKSITFAPAIERDAPFMKDFVAEIAQLVEHNLAKVGVAGPSPVFRSRHFETKERFCNWC